MSRVGRTLKGYLFWTYDRGSFHYDVMVTLILAFIFIAPRFIDFKDHPGVQLSHLSKPVVTAEGKMYQVDASAVDAQDEAMVRNNLLHIIEPISGRVTLLSTEPLRDSAGHIVAYRAVAVKQGRH